MSANNEKCNIYLITPPNFELDNFTKELKIILSLKIVKVLQLRIKNLDDTNLKKYIKEIMPICKDNGVCCILNDRPDIASEMYLDGVHIGINDMSLLETKKIVGRDMIIGVSCYNSIHQAMIAGENGADYVAFGSFFNSLTKPEALKADVNILKKWTKITEIPVVAIGGINTVNCKKLVEYGADFIAISSSVWSSKNNATKIIKKFNSVIKGTILQNNNI